MQQWVIFFFLLLYLQLILPHFEGVILDHEYLGDTYEKTLDLMKEIIERVIREDLRGAGIQIKYYSWSRINFNKGMK